MISTTILSLSRPRFWLYFLGPYILGISTVTTPTDLLRFDVLYGLLYFLLPANILVYGINDYFDADIDVTNPKKYKQEMLMRDNKRTLYRTAVFLSILLALPLLFINTIVSISLVLFIIIGLLYSSPPIRLKTKPFLDSLSNFFYILPGVIGFAMINAQLPHSTILIAASLWAIAMHLFSAIVDIEADQKAGINTTATILKRRKSILLTSFLWLLSVLLVVPYSPVLLVGCIYPILPLLTLHTKKLLPQLYWLFPLINASVGFLLTILIIYAA